MKIFTHILIWLWLLGNIVLSQHYITGGAGLIIGLVDSDGLDRFVTTYNQVNAPVLTNPVSNLSNVFGVRGELGYRYLHDISVAALFGYQRYSFEDVSNFSNGESRSFELSFNNIFIEGELGYKFGNFLVNGMLGFYLNRNVEMETSYTGMSDRSLSGIYKNKTCYSSDIGISFGVQKNSFFLMGKISYPIYTGGNDDRLTDNTPAKVSDNLQKFPEDYWEYVARENYDGIPSNIDGLKFIITLSYAFQMAK
jgi:hypothetical protein